MIHISKFLTESEREKAEGFIRRMKGLLITGDYSIRPSWKNTEFDDQYPLREEQKRAVLRSLTVNDCTKIEANTNARYEASELFFFLKDSTFTVYGEKVTVPVYLKMYIRETKSYDMVIVISFHRSGLYD